MFSYRKGLSAFVLAFVVCSASTTKAQYPKYLLATGSPTFTIAEPVPAGFVNVANGNLHIEIPFVPTPPQRGGRNFVAKMVYDSRIWKIVDNGPYHSWQPTNVPNGNVGWRLVATGLGTLDFDMVAHTCNTYYTYYEYTNYRFNNNVGVTNPRFAVHYETGNSCHTAGGTLSGPTLDATGFLMNLFDNSSFFVGYPKEAIAPDGTRVQINNDSLDEDYWNYDLWKDPDGNYMRRAQNDNLTMVDTVNRTALQRQWNYSTNTLDYIVLTSGGTANFKVRNTGLGEITTDFEQSGVSEYSGYPGNVIQWIQLPDGTKYEFTYAYYAQLTSMKLPTGETITFTYNNFTDAQGNVNSWVNTVARGGGTWTFTPSTSCGTGCDQKVTVTRPSGDETIYSFKLDNGAWNTKTQSYSGSASSGTLMRTVQHDYTCLSDSSTCLTDPVSSGHAFTRLIRTTSTWSGAGPSGNDLVSKAENDYDTFTYSYQGSNYTGSRGNMTAHREYAYGSGSAGSLLRQQVLTYLTDSSYIAKNIVNRVTDAQTKDASGTVLAETLSTYDSGSLTSMTGVTHHDDTNFGTGNTIRGHPTVIKNWTGDSYSSTACSVTWLCTTMAYDTTGQMRSRTDANSNIIQISYTDTWGGGGASTNAYVTQVTLPVSGTLGYSNYLGTGKVATATDQNGRYTTLSYEQYFDRPAGVTLPGGGWTQTDYTSANRQDYSASLFGSTNGQGRLLLDSQGRTYQQILISDPQGYVYKDTTYDTSSRVASVTNPYRSTNDPAYGVTSYQYDGLSRVTQTTLPDNNATHAYYGSGVTSGVGGQTSQLCSSSTYGLGYPVLAKDEAGKKRQSWTDALGRTIESDEFFASGTLGTCYKYDVLGNLIEVDQGVQTRTFSYDALSRRTAETTPEAGNASYYYTTSGGALCSGNPKALCRITDARSVTTTYAYDAENRLTGKTYSDSTPSVSYYYDQTSYNGLNIGCCGKGHRTGMSDGAGQTAWRYTEEGRVAEERRTIAGVTKNIVYTYNLDGFVSSITYPSGMQTSYVESTAGRTTSVRCNFSGCPNYPYFGYNAAYAPQGALASLTVGYISGGFAGMTSTYTYNNRLQPVNLKTTHTNGTVTVLDYTYSFVSGSINDGQVKSVTNNLATGRSQTYTYDEMNRLATAQSQATSGNDCWGLSYGYDRYANLLSASVTNCSAPMLSLSVDPYTNKITNSGFTYDTGGNLTADGSYTFTWNAEGRMASGAGINYTYDGDGRRVKKDNGKLYWYGLKGEVLAESDLSGTITSEYIFFNGKRIARRDPGTGNVYYFLGDRLGSARLVTNATGGIVEESDFYPYGGERVITDTLDNTYKFTGHERDTESGLDHTLYRQYSSNTGRWLSADPKGGKPENPQSWNRYTYGNNPCNLVDRDGGILGPPSGDEGSTPWGIIEYPVRPDSRPHSNMTVQEYDDLHPSRRIQCNAETKAVWLSGLNYAKALKIWNDGNIASYQPEVAATIAALAAVTWQGESSFRTNPTNNDAGDGRVAIGPFQIQYPLHLSATDDPEGVFGMNLQPGQIFNGNEDANLGAPQPSGHCSARIR